MMCGFALCENIFQYKQTGGVCNLESILEEGDGELYVKAVDKPLEHVSANLPLALGETPINPAVSLLEA